MQRPPEQVMELQLPSNPRHLSVKCAPWTWTGLADSIHLLKGFDAEDQDLGIDMRTAWSVPANPQLGLTEWLHRARVQKTFRPSAYVEHAFALRELPRLVYEFGAIPVICAIEKKTWFERVCVVGLLLMCTSGVCLTSILYTSMIHMRVIHVMASYTISKLKTERIPWDSFGLNWEQSMKYCGSSETDAFLTKTVDSGY